jgi:hypothetical protein
MPVQPAHEEIEMNTRAKTPSTRAASLAVLIFSAAVLSGCGVAMPTAPSAGSADPVLTAPHSSSTLQSSSRISTGDEGDTGGSSAGSGTVLTDPDLTLPNSTPLGTPQAPGGGTGPKHGHHGRGHHRKH